MLIHSYFFIYDIISKALLMIPWTLGVFFMVKRSSGLVYRNFGTYFSLFRYWWWHSCIIYIIMLDTGGGMHALSILSCLL